MGVGPLGVKWEWCGHAVRALVKNTLCRLRGSRVRGIDSSTMGKWLGEGVGAERDSWRGDRTFAKNVSSWKADARGSRTGRSSSGWSHYVNQDGQGHEPLSPAMATTPLCCCRSHTVIHAASDREAHINRWNKYRSGPGKFWKNALIPFREVRSGLGH